MDPNDVCRPPFEIGLGRAAATFLLDLHSTDNHLPPEEQKISAKKSHNQCLKECVEEDDKFFFFSFSSGGLG